MGGNYQQDGSSSRRSPSNLPSFAPITDLFDNIHIDAYEALTIVKTRLGYNQAERLWQRMLRPSVVTLVKVDEAIEAGALELFWSYLDKDWGVVDCASLRIMEETGCQQVFAFDRHFTEASKQYGFSLARK